MYLSSKKEGRNEPLETSVSDRKKCDASPVPTMSNGSTVAPSPTTFQTSHFLHSKDILPSRRALSWAEICLEFASHAERNEKDGPAWSPVSYVRGAKRGNSGVELINLAVVDVDDGTPLEDVLAKIANFSYLAHSSFSHTSEKPKYRIILPLASPVSPNNWRAVWERINHLVGGCNDPATKDPARLFYKPAHPPTATSHFVNNNNGKLLSLDDLPELALPVKEHKVTFHPRNSVLPAGEIEGIETSGPDLNFEQGLAHVVNRCAFMQYAAMPDHQNKLPEPLWMAMISNACRFESSKLWIHEASKHHDAYSEDATDRKAEHVRGGSSPITCARIRELGFNGCPSGGCRRPNGSVTAAPAGLHGWMFHRQLTADENGAVQLEDEYSIAGGFNVTPAGVFQTIEDKEGKSRQFRLSSRIDVTALTRDPESSNWGTELRFTDPDGVSKSWALPRELLASAGDSYRASLLKMGAELEPSKKGRDGLAAYLSAARPEARAVSVRQPGWTNGMFVLPDRVYGQANERLVFQTTDPEEMRRFSQKGTLQSWQENIAVPSTGNSRAVASICIGLAPPLLSLLGEDNGGFHLRGNSSTGKTVCLAIGASVWGGSSLIRTWNMTTNGFEGVATMHNDVLLPLDELGQADGKAAGEAAYMLGNGQGKSRADRNGDARGTKKFRNLVLSSGEKSLADVMVQSGQTAMAGQEIRMVEIAADAGCGFGIFENIHGAKSSQAFAEALKQAVTQHHGHAGRAFVRLLADADLQPRLVEKAKALMQRFIDAYVPSGATGQVGRVGRRFGLVASAGELCIELGILPWPEGAAFDACSECFASWIDARGGLGCHEAEQAIAKVKRFIELHGESRFTPMIAGLEDNGGTGKTIHRAGFRRVSDDGRTEFFILPEVYRTEICAGMNPKFVTSTLVERGSLTTDKKGNAQVEKTLPGMGKKRVYHLTSDFMDDSFSPLEIREKVVSKQNLSKLAIKYKV